MIMFVSPNPPAEDTMDKLRDAYNYFGRGSFDYADLANWVREQDDRHGDGWTEFLTIINPSALDVSNSVTMQNALEAFSATWTTFTWVTTRTGFSVELTDSSGDITIGAAVMFGAMKACEDYPVLDDDDWSEREYEWIRSYFDEEAGSCNIPNDVTLDELFTVWEETTYPSSEDCWFDARKLDEYVAEARKRKLETAA